MKKFDEVPRLRKGQKCADGRCKKEATMMGWHYRWFPKARHDEGRVYRPMCRKHFLESFFGLWELDCTPACRKKRRAQNAIVMDDDDFKTYVPSGVAFGTREWCSRHDTPLPIFCVHCGRRLHKPKSETFTHRDEMCFCGKDGDAIDLDMYFKLDCDEQASLKRSLAAFKGRRW